jgi:hypothetical protein
MAVHSSACDQGKIQFYPVAKSIVSIYSSENMDQEKLLIQDLSAPIKSFRLYALEQIIKMGSSPELLAALKQQENIEDDDECRVLLSHAVSAVESRISPEKHLPPPLSGENFLERFRASNPAGKLACLDALPKRISEELAVEAPDLLIQESSPPVAASLVRTFGRRWPRDRLDVLSERLTSGSLSIRFAVLEALIELSPKSLEKFLPRLLVSSEPRTRALAIRGLALIDREEALAHLEALYLGTEKAQKTAAIQNSFFFSFGDIKGILFKFYANETDLELLARGIVLAQINPNTEVPYKLWEIAEASPPAKSTVLKEAIDVSLRLIKETGILGGEFPEYEKNWEIWKNRRIVPEPARKPVVPISSAKITERQTLGERLSILETLGDNDRNKAESLLSELFAAIDHSQEGFSRLFQTASRFVLTGFVPKAIWGMGSTMPVVVAACLEYLSLVSPDSAVPFLGKLTRTKEPEVFIAVFRFFSRHNPPQARSLLERLLKSTRPEEQERGLTAIHNLDFVLTREVLRDFLLKTNDPVLFSRGLAIFAANPDPDNIFLLFSLEKAVSTEFSDQARHVRLGTIKNLVEAKRLGESAPDTLPEELEARYQREQQRSGSSPPAYSLKRLHQHGLSLQAVLDQLLEWRLVFAGAIVIILVLFAGWALSNQGDGLLHTTSVNSGPVLPLPTEITGRVTENFQGERLLVELDSHQSVLVFAKSPVFGKYPIGSVFSGEVVPFRVNPEGIILSHLKKERKPVRKK